MPVGLIDHDDVVPLSRRTGRHGAATVDAVLPKSSCTRSTTVKAGDSRRATTLLAAAKDDRIAAVVADSAWSDVYHWLRPSWRQAAVSPIAPRPLLLITGGADEIVPARDSSELFAAARETASAGGRSLAS